MTTRVARLRVQGALGVLLAVLVSLSVLAHHELMGPMNTAGAPMSASMRAAQQLPASQRTEAAVPHAAQSDSASAAAPSPYEAEAMCSAAGVAVPPLPAALPQGTSVPAPACPDSRVRPLPPGTGPPPPADTSSVLRI